MVTKGEYFEYLLNLDKTDFKFTTEMSAIIDLAKEVEALKKEIEELKKIIKG